MYRSIGLFVGFMLATFHGIAVAQVKASLECKVSGLKINGEKVDTAVP